MRRLLNKKVLGIPLLAVVAGLIVFGGALAAVLILATIPSSVNVTGQAIGVYVEDTCSTPVTDITWGDVARGTAPTRTVYVQNEGTAAVTVDVEAVGLPAGVTLTAPTTALGIGESAPMVLTLTVDPGASFGSTAFDTEFVENT